MGRPSKIDRLQVIAGQEIIDLISGLCGGEQSYDELRETLNLHLLGLGEKPISKQAFARWAKKVEQYQSALKHARSLQDLMAVRLGIATQNRRRGTNPGWL